MMKKIIQDCTSSNQNISYVQS